MTNLHLYRPKVYVVIDRFTGKVAGEFSTRDEAKNFRDKITNYKDIPFAVRLKNGY